MLPTIYSLYYYLPRASTCYLPRASACYLPRALLPTKGVGMRVTYHSLSLLLFLLLLLLTYYIGQGETANSLLQGYNELKVDK